MTLSIRSKNSAREWFSELGEHVRNMIQPVEYRDVRYFRMARTILGRAFYWTGVYYLDGLLVDSGPPNLAREMTCLSRELPVRQCSYFLGSSYSPSTS